MKKHDKKGGSNPDYSSVSAAFYLSKFHEFSENVLARDSLGHDVELVKSLSFIKEILLADAVILAEIDSSKASGLLRLVVNEDSVSKNLEDKQASILTSLFDDVFTFGADDEGAREAVGILLEQFIPMSGFSVPIKAGENLNGVLAAFYSLDVPATHSKILFLQSMASVLSHLRQSQNLLSQVDIKHARHVFDAKREWEGTVDSLEQLIIVFDENAKVIRANKAIQYWETDGFDAVIGNKIESVINYLSGDEIKEIYPSWDNVWANLNDYQHVEWISDTQNGQILRFSLRKIANELGRNKTQHHGYAVLFVEDITKSKETEKHLQNYATHLESTLEKRNAELERVNEKLQIKLLEEHKTRIALARSEEKYQTLLNCSQSGICQLEDGRISFHNNRFSEIFKIPENKLSDLNFIELFDKKDHSILHDLINNLDSQGDSGNIRIVRGYDAHGKKLWLKLSLSCITFHHDKNIIVNVVDITQLKNIELSLRKSEDRLQKLSGKLINAQENERKRLALELHDGLGQSLSSIKYSIEDLRMRNYCGDDKDCAKVLDSVIDYTKDTIDETRRMAMDLRPSMLDDLGIISTINWFCRKFQETYKSITIDKQVMLGEDDIVDSRKIVIYRIMQEALNNVAKHSDADIVCVKLCKIEEGFIQLLIADNGNGIKSTAASITTGLSGMRERAELSGGSFILSENVPKGVKIDIRWPGESAALIR